MTFWHYFLQANFLIKGIILLLCFTSVYTWTIILQHTSLIRRLDKARIKFEDRFWSGITLTELYDSLENDIPSHYLESIFYSGFSEFLRLRNNGCQSSNVLLEAVSRAMYIAHSQAAFKLEKPIGWLAVISMTTPYVGFLGYTLGIISSLDSTHQNTLAGFRVLPGFIDSLILVMLSLFAAIPALVFYYRYTYRIDLLLKRYHIFQEEFIAFLLRQGYEETHYEKL